MSTGSSNSHWLSEITSTSLVNRNADVPSLSFEDIDETAPAEITEASAKAVWVPNRNGVMLNIAGAFAESRECDYLLVGFNGEEAVTFPDNSLAYVQAMDNAFSYSTQNGVKVLAPSYRTWEDRNRQKGSRSKSAP